MLTCNDRTMERDVSGSSEVPPGAMSIEQAISSLLLAAGPKISSRNNYDLASKLIDSAAEMISLLKERVSVLEGEQVKAIAREAEWAAMLAKWQDIASSMQDHVHDLESKLAEMTQRSLRAELRAQNAEEEMMSAESGSLNLCNKVFAVFGTQTGSEGAQMVPAKFFEDHDLIAQETAGTA